MKKMLAGLPEALELTRTMLVVGRPLFAAAAVIFLVFLVWPQDGYVPLTDECEPDRIRSRLRAWWKGNEFWNEHESAMRETLTHLRAERAAKPITAAEKRFDRDVERARDRLFQEPRSGQSIPETTNTENGFSRVNVCNCSHRASLQN